MAEFTGMNAGDHSDEKGVSLTYTLGGNQRMRAVSESGFYKQQNSGANTSRNYRRWPMHDADRFPQPNARYRDTHGRIVTITGIDSGRVVYMRQGYPYPCACSLEKFQAEFIEVK
ncbi:DUF4222 domain-containing protein [Edwardsiella piscicida]|uniref:DUF4222 domain-containing protein n=2 Tax=Edwardsiella piscicida TaxID=1263550 RepID=UPI002018E365|nr:DUF4222 domain-containing protein [Edwardsiella piscicida]UCQ21847.1 DUF4222 domain-containing protein [Edwardsiella piscicida]